jgi:uncharacterized protein YbdZ (MbtH family)
MAFSYPILTEFQYSIIPNKARLPAGWPDNSLPSGQTERNLFY